MKHVAQLSEKERRELFSETANAMNITAAAAEKTSGFAGYYDMFLRMKR